MNCSMRESGVAITGSPCRAEAHKLARIVYHLLGTKEAYNESVFHKSEADTIRRAEYRLRRQAGEPNARV